MRNRQNGFGQVENGNNKINDYYVYTAEIASPLAAGAQQPATIGIEANSSFTWVKTALFASLAGAAQTYSSQVLPQVDVQIRDSGSGTLLQYSPVPICTIAGNGQLPFVLPVPRIFNANSTINITFTNVSAAETYTILKFVMIGYKTFFL